MNACTRILRARGFLEWNFNFTRTREIGSFTRRSTPLGSKTIPSSGFWAKNRNRAFGRGRDNDVPGEYCGRGIGVVFIDKYCIYRVVGSFTVPSPSLTRRRSFSFSIPDDVPERNARETAQTWNVQNGNNFASASPPLPPPSIMRSRVDDDIITIPHAFPQPLS